jgi:ADP-ribose pyrophosphatase YjhB (NUDIX family)
VKIKTISCGTATLRKSKDGYEVLLVQPRAWQEKWAFPKGHLDEGETQEDAAVRETLEETGVAVQLLPHLLGSFEVKMKHEHKTVFIYLATPTNEAACEPDPKDDENHDVRWWPLNALPQPIQSQETIFAALEDAARGLLL